MIVVDASIAAEWYLREHDDAVIRAALLEVSRAGAIAPGSFWLETLEALLRAARRSRMIGEEIASAIMHLSNLEIVAVHSPLTMVAGLAEKYALGAYDAGYLSVAKQRGALLATLDMKLVNAARSENCLWTPPPPDEVERKFSLLLAG